MPRTAKVFMTNRSQAVRLPKEFQFDSDEVFIRKDAFMENVEDLPVQERER
jgi:antitoxin VapB